MEEKSYLMNRMKKLSEEAAFLCEKKLALTNGIVLLIDIMDDIVYKKGVD